MKLPDIKRGRNELVIETEYNQKGFLENVYLLGDFAVIDGVVTAPAGELNFGDITKQGLPFYTGNIYYIFETEITEDGEYFARVPEFSAPVLEVSVDGERKGLIAYAPHRICLGNLTRGAHEIKVTLYGNRFNAFGIVQFINIVSGRTHYPRYMSLCNIFIVMAVLSLFRVPGAMNIGVVVMFGGIWLYERNRYKEEQPL